MRADSDALFQIDQTVVTTSAGEVALPMCFYDASHLISLFHVEGKRLVDALGDVDVEPALDRKGRGIVGLAFYEYRRASIAAYSEVGLAAQVVRRGDKPPVFPLFDMMRKPASRKSFNYLLHLPVTTQAANAAGIEIWGFPKFLAEIPIAIDGRRFEGAVIDPVSAASIVTFGGDSGAGLSLPGMDLRIYTELHGAPMEALVDTRYRAHSSRGGDMTLKVGEADHAMTETLRALDLHGKKPFVTQMTERFKSRLNALKAL